MELFSDHKYRMLIDIVKSYYQEPHRVYHGWNHISEGIAKADAIPNVEFNWTLGQQLAWLFHDIVYIPGCSDNESNSVKLMYHIFKSIQFRYNTDFGLTDHIGVAETIIRCTHIQMPSTKLAASVLDIDMSCFADAKCLRRANNDIVQEFCLPNYAGRINFLEQLNRKTIYHTEWAKANWESLAHTNIGFAIRALTEKTK